MSLEQLVIDLELLLAVVCDHDRRHLVGDDELGLAVVQAHGLEGVNAEGMPAVHGAATLEAFKEGTCRDCLLGCAGRGTHSLSAASGPETCQPVAPRGIRAPEAGLLCPDCGHRAKSGNGGACLAQALAHSSPLPQPICGTRSLLRAGQADQARPGGLRPWSPAEGQHARATACDVAPSTRISHQKKI